MPPKRRATKKAAAKVAAQEPEKEEVVAEQPTEETSQVAEVPAEVVAENGTNDSVENDEDDNEPEPEENEEEEAAEDSKEPEKKQEKKKLETVKLHSFEELGFFSQRKMARTFMDANKRPMKNVSFRFPPMRTKNNKKNDKVKPLTGPQRQLWTKFQNTMLLDAVVCWGEKLNYKICSSVALATHSREMQFTITKCRQQVVRGRDAFPENMHTVVMKVNDDLGRGMGPVLHWMHTGELILKKENFEHVMTAAVALKVTVLKRKLAEIAKDYEFHWVELPENAKEKERRAKREAARKAKADAKETEEKEADNEEEEAADEDAEMEDDAEANEEETNEEEATEEAPAETTEAEIDPSFKKIGGKEMLDKIKELRRIKYFTELPEESLLYKTHIKRYTQQNRQSGNKPDNKRSNDDRNKTENNKRQRTNTGSTAKKEWTSKSTHNGRQVKREAQSSQSIYRAQPAQPQPQMYQPPMYQQPPQQAAYYGQPPAYQYQPPQQYHQQYQPPQPTWQNQGRRY